MSTDRGDGTRVAVLDDDQGVALQMADWSVLASDCRVQVILTIHVQLSERTRGLVGAGELALMKRTAYLVNTARGPIVDEAALVQAHGTSRL